LPLSKEVAKGLVAVKLMVLEEVMEVEEAFPEKPSVASSSPLILSACLWFPWQSQIVDHDDPWGYQDQCQASYPQNIYHH